MSANPANSPPPTTGLHLDGNEVSKRLRSHYTSLVSTFISSNPTLSPPSLSVVLVGNRKDSETYVRMKTKACEEIGIVPKKIVLPEDATQETLIQTIQSLNEDKAIHGILVQLPLPKHMNESAVISHISPHKDVDGLTHGSSFTPCTPLGCIELLDQYGVGIEGKHGVVIGRSHLVGKPVALLLLGRSATVTICHSKTRNIEEFVKQGDIIIAAIGKPEFIKGEWIKQGAVVVDVGINPVEDSTKKTGYRLVGDVEYSKAKDKCSYITPVPGGVGPMTVCMLMKNTLVAFEKLTGNKILTNSNSNDNKEKEKEKESKSNH